MSARRGRGSPAVRDATGPGTRSIQRRGPSPLSVPSVVHLPQRVVIASGRPPSGAPRQVGAGVDRPASRSPKTGVQVDPRAPRAGGCAMSRTGGFRVLVVSSTWRSRSSRAGRPSADVATGPGSTARSARARFGRRCNWSRAEPPRDSKGLGTLGADNRSRDPFDLALTDTLRNWRADLLTGPGDRRARSPGTSQARPLLARRIPRHP